MSYSLQTCDYPPLLLKTAFQKKKDRRVTRHFVLDHGRQMMRMRLNARILQRNAARACSSVSSANIPVKDLKKVEVIYRGAFINPLRLLIRAKVAQVSSLRHVFQAMTSCVPAARGGGGTGGSCGLPRDGATPPCRGLSTLRCRAGWLWCSFLRTVVLWEEVCGATCSSRRWYS